MKVDPDVLKLVDPYEFDRKFFEMTQVYSTYQEAYEAVEQVYKSVFGDTKYSNYDSYRKAKEKRIKA